jgi:MYXO-CTERM domain-containing protein
VNGERLWQNDATDETNGALVLKDVEWRFEDIDVSAVVASGATSAKVRFEIASDIDTQLGGWNVDDVAIVAWTPPAPAQVGTTGEGGAGEKAGGPALDPGGGCACGVAGSPGRGASLGALGMLALAALATRRFRRPATSCKRA